MAITLRITAGYDAESVIVDLGTHLRRWRVTDVCGHWIHGDDGDHHVWDVSLDRVPGAHASETQLTDELQQGDERFRAVARRALWGMNSGDRMYRFICRSPELIEAYPDEDYQNLDEDEWEALPDRSSAIRRAIEITDERPGWLVDWVFEYEDGSLHARLTGTCPTGDWHTDDGDHLIKDVSAYEWSDEKRPES